MSSSSAHSQATEAAERLRQSLHEANRLRNRAAAAERSAQEQAAARSNGESNNSNSLVVDQQQQRNVELHGQRSREGANQPPANDDADRDDDDDDDDNSQRTQNNNLNLDDLHGSGIMEEFTEADPFNVDPYKILHFPGATQCRGRNIATILDDRSMYGARFRNPAFYRGNYAPPPVDDDDECDSNEEEGGGGGEEETQQQQQKEEEEPLLEDGISTPVDNGASSPRPMSMDLSSANGEEEDDAALFQSPPADQQLPIGSSSYLSPPILQQQQQQQQQSLSLLDYPQTPTNSTPNSSGNKTPTLPSHSNPEPKLSESMKVPTGPIDVTTEITSYGEYAAATKFKASYFKHLNGGLDTPVRPGDPRNRRGGNDGRGGGGRGNDNNGNDNDDGLTQEQRETNRQLQQHLQQHNFPQRRLNPLRRPASDGSGTNNNNNNNNAGGNANAGGGRRQQQQHDIPIRQIQQQLGAMRRNDRGRGQPPGRHPTASNPNPAISTISIAFSPDARTLASTHGDHTVKITCCHTGKLLRQLEGHPRTPWTVKYHPTNARIVASGCLGFQVRVWDWNFQREGLRKQRRAERERKWRGRYDFRRHEFDGYGGRGMMAGGGGSDHADHHYGKSPRGVVEHPWKQQGGSRGFHDDDDEEGTDCAAGGRKSWEVPAHLAGDEDGDDFASLVLASAGIPPEDPAYYDAESEAFNYEDGIGVCLNMIRLHSAVISLSFHPSGEMLAMASGSTLHLWDYNEEKRKRKSKVAGGNSSNVLTLKHLFSSRESDSRILNRSRNSDFPRGQTMDFRHESALRCVHFPPSGDQLIVGGVNPPSANEGLPNRANDPRSRGGRGGMSGGGMSFHLRMWDFDLDAVLNPSSRDSADEPSNNGGRSNNSMRLPAGGQINDDGELSWNYRLAKEALSNPRLIIPRVLLYNDGGFDLSSDGKILSACADFWLPDGVDNAMELIESQRQLEEEELYQQQLQLQQRQSMSSSPDSNDGVSRDRTSSPVSGLSSSNISSPPPRQGQPSYFPDPRTPPPNFNYTSLEPPSPPGKRNIANMPHGRGHQPVHNPHPLSVVAAGHPAHKNGGGRYIPHIVTVSLDMSPPPDGEPMPLSPTIVRTEPMRRHPNLGKLLMAAPLDGTKSSGVTCVKLSPSAEYCLLGYGVRENIPSVDDGGETRHPVTSLYNVKKGMKHVCTLTCGDDDVNIARFHPESGHGFVYGTKQGRVRCLAKRPWNYYHL